MFKLEFTNEELAIINKALIHMPYIEVVKLISDINCQLENQEKQETYVESKDK